MANKIIEGLSVGIIDSMNETQMRDTLKSAWAEEAQEATRLQAAQEAEEARKSAAQKGIDDFFAKKEAREGWGKKKNHNLL